MTDEQIREMLSDVVQEVDYDLWKSIFLETHWECDPEEGEARLDRLVDIAKGHLPYDQ